MDTTPASRYSVGFSARLPWRRITCPSLGSLIPSAGKGVGAVPIPTARAASSHFYERAARATRQVLVVQIWISGVQYVSKPSNAHLAFDHPPDLKGVKVLAVDDELDARMLLDALFKQCGAEIRTCGSVAEALETLQEYKPDVLVSDIGMPGEDGYSLIRKIRELELETGERLPAVALTAFARTEDRVQALTAGYNMHVPKPVEPAELALVISSLVK